MKLITVILFITSCSILGFSQDGFQPKQSLKIQITLPNSTNNSAFNEIMQGLVNLSAGYQYTLKEGFSVGAGYKMSYYTINEFKTPDQLQGGLLLNGPYGKVGFEKFYGNFGLDIGMRVGYSLNFSANDNCRTELGKAYRFDSGYFEPILGFALMATENSSFRLSISYATYGFQFRPHMFCQETFPGYKSEDLNKEAQAFSIGFGYSFYFGDKH